MNRKLISKLAEWKENQCKKPILLTGARGVGKTYLLLDFAKTFFGEYLYINFEREPFWYERLTGKGDDEGDNIRNNFLQKYFHFFAGQTPDLLIFDEIGACADPGKVMELILKIQSICPVIAASSKAIGMEPVIMDNLLDKVSPLILYPMDFEEFLTATGNAWYAEVIQAHFLTDKGLPDIVHKELLALFEDYLQIGGMPSVISEYMNTDSKYNISEKHRLILDSYLSDMRMGNTDSEALKISQIIGVMDKQLIKENHKFQYSLIRKGATHGMYVQALQFIQDTYYGLPCCKAENGELMDIWEAGLSKGKVADSSGNFKFYYPDVGILHSLFRTQTDEITAAMKKSLLENYIAQSLAVGGHNYFYWESSSQAKIEFLIWINGRVVPLEVRSGENTRSKNISIFRKNCNLIKDSIKISERNFAYVNQVKYVPVYAVFCI